ncbi:MAG TPA: family 10 glycosylhydrolase [Vicinamibacteria bacterium]
MRLALALILAAAAPAGPAAPEMRGLWVVRTGLGSPAAVDKVIEQAERGGFNALFVQVRGRGDAFYASDIVPRAELLKGQPADFDPLAQLLARARARGIEVHAWVNLLLSASFARLPAANHIVAQHPEWVMIPRSNAAAALHAPRDRLLALSRLGDIEDVEGYYLSPSAPGVAEHLTAVVRELLNRYAVDGLHLDFIRYPTRDHDYSRAALEGFHGGPAPAAELLAGPGARPEAWDNYRREAVTRLVERLVVTARATRPHLRLSAAVVADEEQALHHKHQAWPTWASLGLLDAVCPMAYSAEAAVFRSQVELARARAGSRTAVWAGVGAYRLDARETVERVRAARQLGAAGVVLFSHEWLEPPALDQLRATVFVAPAASGAGTGTGPATR